MFKGKTLKLEFFDVSSASRGTWMGNDIWKLEARCDRVVVT